MLEGSGRSLAHCILHMQGRLHGWPFQPSQVYEAEQVMALALAPTGLARGRLRRRLAPQRDGDRGRAGVAVGVGDGIVEHIDQGRSGTQQRHRLIRCISTVGIGPARSQLEPTVGPGQRHARRAGYTCCSHPGDRRGDRIGAEAVGHIACAQRCHHLPASLSTGWSASGHAGGIGARSRRVVDDAYGQRARCGRSGRRPVGHDQRDAVGTLAGAGSGMGDGRLERVLVGERSGGRGCRSACGHRQAGHPQLPLTGVDDRGRAARSEAGELCDREGGTADRHRSETGRRGYAERAGGDTRFARRAIRGQARLEHRRIADGRAIAVDRGDRRRTVVHAGDFDADQRGVAPAIRVGDPVVEALQQALARGQRLHRRVRGVERVGVGAVRRDDERAVEPCERCAADEAGGASALDRTRTDIVDRQLGIEMVRVGVERAADTGLHVAGD